jgi:ribose/xylose/arabinose/galactoside ABC-type transport system permease subunit
MYNGYLCAFVYKVTFTLCFQVCFYPVENTSVGLWVFAIGINPDLVNIIGIRGNIYLSNE